MAERTLATQTAKPTVTPIANGVLQRACACGNHSHGQGECTECKKKREMSLQRAVASPAPVHDVPPIVHEVLRSPGQPLDAQTRAFMEPRFGQDFSHVRVHTDGRAAQSARAVDALAYTVGRDVVFGTDEYQPTTSTGRRLMAHELTHVVQQHQIQPLAPLHLTSVFDHSETEARQVAATVVDGSIAMTNATPSTPTITTAGHGIQRDVGWARKGPFPYGSPESMPTTDVSESVTETISNAPAPYGAWNGRFSWSSKFHLTLDLNTNRLIVSVKLYSTATRAQKQNWKAAIEGKWSNRFDLVKSPETPGSPERKYRIMFDLQWVDDAGKADYTITPNAPGATEGGRSGSGGTTSMTGWGTSDTVDVTHEFGHMMGNPEDYFTTNGRDYTNGGRRRGFRDVGGGIMNNPSEDPFSRHYELIRKHAAKLLGVPESRLTVR